MDRNDLRLWRESIESAKIEVLKRLRRRTRPVDLVTLVAWVPATRDRVVMALHALSRQGKVRYFRTKKKCSECGRKLTRLNGWVLVRKGK